MAGIVMGGARAAGTTTTRQTLVIEPIDPKLVRAMSANGSVRNYWPRLTGRKRVMVAVQALARAARWTPFTRPVTATFRWIVPTKGRRDLDNLASNGIVKATLDALSCEDGWLVDDSSTYVVEVKTEMAYEKGRRALEIILETVDG